MDITLIDDNVLIEPEKGDDVTQGGIVIPDASTWKPNRGTVVAIGVGRPLKDGTRFPMQVAVGDKVYYGGAHLSDVELEGRKYVVVPEQYLLGVSKNG